MQMVFRVWRSIVTLIIWYPIIVITGLMHSSCIDLWKLFPPAVSADFELCCRYYSHKNQWNFSILDNDLWSYSWKKKFRKLSRGLSYIYFDNHITPALFLPYLLFHNPLSFNPIPDIVWKPNGRPRETNYVHRLGQ